MSGSSTGKQFVPKAMHEVGCYWQDSHAAMCRVLAPGAPMIETSRASNLKGKTLVFKSLRQAHFALRPHFQLLSFVEHSHCPEYTCLAFISLPMLTHSLQTGYTDY